MHTARADPLITALKLHSSSLIIIIVAISHPDQRVLPPIAHLKAYSNREEGASLFDGGGW